MAFFFIRMQVILASNSPRRKELFFKICPSFITAPANVNEDVEEGVSPLQTVKILARRKAEHAFQTALNAGMGGGKPLIVLGSDTVVAYNGAILGKPKDEEEAAAMLSCFRAIRTPSIRGYALSRKRAFGARRTHPRCNFMP